MSVCMYPHTIDTPITSNLSATLTSVSVEDSALEFDPPAFVRGRVKDASANGEDIVLDLPAAEGDDGAEEDVSQGESEDEIEEGGGKGAGKQGRKKQKTMVGNVEVEMDIPGQKSTKYVRCYNACNA